MYEYLDTITGDAEVIVKANTFPELLSESAMAMINLMYDPSRVKAERKMEITAEGSDKEELLYNWLTEILVLQDSENIFFREFLVSAPKDGKVTGIGVCGEGKPELVKAYVKAVSLHNFYVRRNALWEARITFDL